MYVGEKMWGVLAEHWLVHAETNITASDLRTNEVYESVSPLPDSVSTSLNNNTGTGISSSFEFIKREQGGYVLTVNRVNSSGLELKQLTVELEKSTHSSLIQLIMALVTEQNSTLAQLTETQKNLSVAQSALDVMVDEKQEIQTNALKSISSIIAERNRLLNERNP